MSRVNGSGGEPNWKVMLTRGSWLDQATAYDLTTPNKYDQAQGLLLIKRITQLLLSD